MKRIILDNEQIFNNALVAQEAQQQFIQQASLRQVIIQQQQAEQHEREIVKQYQNKLQLEQDKLHVEKEQLQLEKAAVSQVQQKINLENEALQQHLVRQQEEIKNLYETVQRQQELLADLSLSDINSNISVEDEKGRSTPLRMAISDNDNISVHLDTYLHREDSIDSLSEHSNIDYDVPPSPPTPVSDDSFVQIELTGDGDY